MEISQLAARIAADVGCTTEGAEIASAPSSLGVAQVALAAALSLAIYAVWFRAAVGPWCLAMWAGTAPPVIILLGFGVLLSAMRRWWA